MSEEWEAIQWRFYGKGDRITAFCGHTHRKEITAKECASENNRSGNGIWVARRVVYYDPNVLEWEKDL